jgi:hypothetical protein
MIKRASLSSWGKLGPERGATASRKPASGALREACAAAAHALAAPIARAIARMALAALGLSGDPVHEPVHARGPHPAILHCSYHQ